jgi:hypothetical protein
MYFFKILVLAVLTFLFMTVPTQAILHSNVVTLNHTDYVNIDRSIVRGGKTYPLYYSSREDLYAYAYGDIACEMENIYYDEVVQLLEELHDMKATTYRDLNVTIFETKGPMYVENVYKAIKNHDAFQYCQLNGVTNHPDMGLTYVVPIDGDMGPQGINQMYWFTKFDRMLTKFPSPFTSK